MWKRNRRLILALAVTMWVIVFVPCLYLFIGSFFPAAFWMGDGRYEHQSYGIVCYGFTVHFPSISFNRPTKRVLTFQSAATRPYTIFRLRPLGEGMSVVHEMANEAALDPKVKVRITDSRGKVWISDVRPISAWSWGDEYGEIDEGPTGPGTAFRIEQFVRYSIEIEILTPSDLPLTVEPYLAWSSDCS